LSYRRKTGGLKAAECAEARVPPPGKAEGRSPEELPEPRWIDQLSSLPVRRVPAAPRAELRKLDPIGIVLPVLRRPV